MRSWLGVAAIAAGLIAGCGGNVGGSGGSGGSTGGTTSSGGTGGDTGGTTSAGGTTGTGGGTMCGGIAGIPCAANEFCDFPDDRCGGDDGTGVCKPRPDGCPDIYQPVCTCAGTVAGNPCDAETTGQDVSILGGCTAPEGMFACGAGFCEKTMYYCQRTVSDVVGIPDSYGCQPLPDGCNPASCACLAGEVCGDMCSEADGGLTLTCPGG